MPAAAGWVGAGLTIALLSAVGVVIWFGRDAIASVSLSGRLPRLKKVSDALRVQVDSLLRQGNRFAVLIDCLGSMNMALGEGR